MKVTSVTGCVSCGKPALLVGDEAPKAFPACFWCLAERRPGASKLFLDEVRIAERERVAGLLEAEAKALDDSGAPAVDWNYCVMQLVRRIRSGDL